MPRLLPLLAFLVTRTLLAQDATPVVKLDRDELLIGQQVHLDLRVPYRVDRGAAPTIVWPTITDTLTGHIAVVHDSGVDTLMPDKERDPYALAQVRTLTLTSWDSGYWALPPFTFVINGDSIQTAALLLTVNTVGVDTTQAYRDIKEIYEVPFSLMDWLREHWPWVAGGVAAVAILVGIFIFLRRRARRPKVEPVVVEQILPLHTRTLKALAELDAKKLWQQGLAKEYHTALTDILRGYVEERFAVPAMESTTDELMAALRLTGMGAAQREQLGNLLRLADMVKFAKWTPVPAENEQLMAGAIRLVNETSSEQRADAPLA